MAAKHGHRHEAVVVGQAVCTVLRQDVVRADRGVDHAARDTRAETRGHTADTTMSRCLAAPRVASKGAKGSLLLLRCVPGEGARGCAEQAKGTPIARYVSRIEICTQSLESERGRQTDPRLAAHVWRCSCADASGLMQALQYQ